LEENYLFDIFTINYENGVLVTEDGKSRTWSPTMAKR